MKRFTFNEIMQHYSEYVVAILMNEEYDLMMYDLGYSIDGFILGKRLRR